METKDTMQSYLRCDACGSFFRGVVACSEADGVPGVYLECTECGKRYRVAIMDETFRSLQERYRGASGKAASVEEAERKAVIRRETVAEFRRLMRKFSVGAEEET